VVRKHGYAGGTRLAQVRIVERMAEKIGDSAFAAKCREWIEAGTQLLEEKLWGDGYYLSSLDEASGKRTELVLAFQLDGEWIARLHGLPSVFRPERVKIGRASCRERV